MQVDGVLGLVPKSIREITWTPPWAPTPIRFLETPGLGFVLTILVILLIGALARGFVGRRVVNLVEDTLRAVPLLGTVYFAVRQLLEQVFSDRAQSFQKVVLVEFPRRGAYCLGFVTARGWPGVEDAVGAALISVFVPTTPNPTSGFFVMFPEADVRVLDMTVEEAFKALMSSGIVQPTRGGELHGTSILAVTQELDPVREELVAVSALPIVDESADERVELMGMSMSELEDFAETVLGEKRFRGRQLFKWIYQKRVVDFSGMTDMAKAVRAKLAQVAKISRFEVRAAPRSADGTIKFLWGLHDGLQIESVLIPEEKRMTLCISSQVGCNLGCDFCVTAKGGFTRNLTKAEILGQIVQAQEHAPDTPITNIVLMGMGEPLLNLVNVVESMETAQDTDGLGLSHRRITLSTVGLVPQLEKLGQMSRINLAVSLHGSTEEARSALMPGERQVLDPRPDRCPQALPLPNRKAITIEYILLRGINDDIDDAHRLARLLRACAQRSTSSRTTTTRSPSTVAPPIGTSSPIKRR